MVHNEKDNLQTILCFYAPLYEKEAALFK